MYFLLYNYLFFKNLQKLKLQFFGKIKKKNHFILLFSFTYLLKIYKHLFKKSRLKISLIFFDTFQEILSRKKIKVRQAKSGV